MSDEVTNEQAASDAGAPPDNIEQGISAFLADRTKTVVPADHDLFASGLVSSMFAMELIVHLEQAYGVAIVGDNLMLDNFRTIERMVALVTRLRTLATAAGA